MKEFFNIEIVENELYTLQKKLGLDNKNFNKMVAQQIKRISATGRKIIRKKTTTTIKTKTKKWIGRRVKIQKIRYKNNTVSGGLWVGCDGLNLGDFKGAITSSKQGLNHAGILYPQAFLIKKNKNVFAFERFKKINGKSKLEIVRKDIFKPMFKILDRDIKHLFDNDLLNRIETEIKRRLNL